MTTAIIALTIAGWIVVGLIMRQPAERAGYIFGFHSGAGLLSGPCVTVQAPAIIVRSLWLDAWAYALSHEPSGSEPDDAFERLDEDDR